MKTIKQFRKTFFIFSACLGIVIGADAQTTCSRSSIPGDFVIKTTSDYKRAQDSVQILAYGLYKLYEMYPSFSYVHQVDDHGKIVAVSVIGIRDAQRAEAAARNLMSLEILGDAINRMDKSLLPTATAATREKKMTREETLKYQPTPRYPKEKRTNEKSIASLASPEL